MTYSKLLRLAGIGVVMTIWVLSLIPINEIDVPGSDKLHHVIAYFSCMFVWGQLYRQPVARLKLAIVFILMGAMIECAQGMTTYRDFEWFDMVANAIGVTTAWFAVTVQLSLQRRFASPAKQ